MRNFILIALAVFISFTSLAQVGSITSDTTVCVGGSVTLSCTPGGGTWSSSDPSVATIGSASGTVTGVADGVVTISYDAGASGIATLSFTVNPVPGSIVCPISGCNVCEGATITLTDPTSGGMWTSSDPGVATVGSVSGDVTGVATGTISVTYTLPTGCYVTGSVIVNPAPAPIGGTGVICMGGTLTLTDATPGGAWSSSGAVASVSSTGDITTVSDGTETITYSIPSGCSATTDVTVDPLPGPISGPSLMCVSSCVSLSDAVPGGTWSSSDPGVATVGASSGTLCAVAPGVVDVTYTMSGGCFALISITVNPSPSPISGISEICVGATTTLSCSTPGGTWSSGGASATVGATTGIVTGTGPGVETISYALPTGCSSSYYVTVDVTPAPVSGGMGVCLGSSLTLSSSPSGGDWTSANPAVAAVGLSSGIVSGMTLGVTTITYTLPTGCFATGAMSINPVPGTISGAGIICVGSTTTMTVSPGGGTWSSADTTIAAVAAGTGVVTGIATGGTTITYTLPGGCYSTATISINPIPATITGGTSVCIGSTSTLSTTTPGGTWSSSSTAIATIGTTGLLTGISAGTATVTYLLPTGCYRTVTVNVVSSPAPITGPGTVCVFGTMTLADATPGGTWISSNPALAPIGSSSGLVTGVSVGTLTISYSLGGGCFTTTTIGVDPLPAPITGPANVCIGFTIVKADASTGGTWSSSGTYASVDPSTGVVTGVAAGSETITYTLPTGCLTSASVSVNPLPCLTLDVPAVTSYEVEMFPNPAYDELTIKTDAGAYDQVTITNSVGQVLVSTQIKYTQTVINVSQLPPALYHVTLKGEHGTVVRKFVKQ